MVAHEVILAAVQRLCADRGGFRFILNEVVRALPGLNANTVRTQVSSYCCVTARRHHAHHHPYFRRVGFGEYELEEKYRRAPAPRPRSRPQPRKDTIHAVISASDGFYVAECLEVAVVTQGRTLDDTMANLREALDLHLDDQERRATGIVARPRIAVTFETALAG
jgi:predicted RNase H-like HicB family nuclease